MKCVYYGPRLYHLFSSVSQSELALPQGHVGLFKYLLTRASSFLGVSISSPIAPVFTDHSHPPKTLGEGAGSLNDPNKEALAKTEVSLTLTNKFDVPGDENAEMDARTILLK